MKEYGINDHSYITEVVMNVNKHVKITLYLPFMLLMGPVLFFIQKEILQLQMHVC